MVKNESAGTWISHLFHDSETCHKYMQTNRMSIQCCSSSKWTQFQSARNLYAKWNCIKSETFCIYRVAFSAIISRHRMHLVFSKLLSVPICFPYFQFHICYIILLISNIMFTIFTLKLLRQICSCCPHVGRHSEYQRKLRSKQAYHIMD